jgi:hypothetical protein
LHTISRKSEAANRHPAPGEFREVYRVERAFKKMNSLPYK